ncbi:MAG: cytochrome C [Verrucomicrobia bacterium]|nr:cytochrome C [Verrucomicrobiota bacterium]
MNSQPSPARTSRGGMFRNWITLTGAVIMLASLFAFLLLFTIDLFAHFGNPYVGILTFFVAPAFLIFGLALAIGGALWERRAIRRAGSAAPPLEIDLSHPRDRRILAYFAGGAALFLLFTAMGSYHTYHFTESTTFCGQACHQVMKPEMVTYQQGPHARVSCTACHIGPGATWFVRSKLSGTYQVYATLQKKYPRPIPTPIKNLRPAQETCEQCHWPKKFVGNLDRTFTYYLSDESNTVHTIRMLMKVGGADPTHGPVGGIHWHMNVGNRVEYYATDATRQKIPWVRLIDPQGVVREYRSPGFTNEIRKADIRVMDCMDCHNRPAHVFETPSDAVNLAMSLGSIDPTLPSIKANAVHALVQPYETETEGLQQIATILNGRYPDGTKDPRVAKAIAAVQQIYRDNFFPEMKADWRAYPDNISHKNWLGCLRCHDGKHVTADGKEMIKANDCNACHIILAQGSGDDLTKLDIHGQEFKHPGDELSPGDICHDCHTGE